MILLIDNYDSFSFNLYQLIGSIDPEIQVIRNDTMTVSEIASLNPRAIILSPGPGKPADAGICVDAARYFAGKVPLLGVCLGHQAICEAFGGTVTYAKNLMHGKQSTITIDSHCPIFSGMGPTIQAARYHSLAALESTLKDPLEVVARSEENEVMAVQLKGKAVYGVQFHPESILTPQGKTILENFLRGDHL